MGGSCPARHLSHPLSRTRLCRVALPWAAEQPHVEMSFMDLTVHSPVFWSRTRTNVINSDSAFDPSWAWSCHTSLSIRKCCPRGMDVTRSHQGVRSNHRIASAATCQVRPCSTNDVGTPSGAQLTSTRSMASTLRGLTWAAARPVTRVHLIRLRCLYCISYCIAGALVVRISDAPLLHRLDAF